MNDKRLHLPPFYVLTISTFFLVQSKLCLDHSTQQFLSVKIFDCISHLGKQPRRRGKVIPRVAADYNLQLKTTFDSCLTKRLLLNVDMTVSRLIKVEKHYNDNKKI